VYNLKDSNFIWFDDREASVFLSNCDNNHLQSISIACSPICNMNCPHCIYSSHSYSKDGLSKKEKLKILDQAYKLGAKYLQICHEGEPFLDKAVMPLIEKASSHKMKIFIYTNASLITPSIAKLLFENEVCIGVHFDSLNPKVFDKMLGSKGGSKNIHVGLQNLLDAGYDKPFNRDGRLYTRLGLVTTLTAVNTSNVDEMKSLGKFAWDNKIFFGIARLEKGGRAIGKTWERMRIKDKEKIVNFVNWCSEQTGIDYWQAQPKPYCIGVCGLQVADNGDVWITEYGGSCDFTEPDGESFPNNIITIGNVKQNDLNEIWQRLWDFRKTAYYNGVLDKKLEEYERTKDTFPNGLQDCGSARTYTLFKPFYDYVKRIVTSM
jgi:MoaA/NifB/PqqE/SkfB family radical SAM enzyme